MKYFEQEWKSITLKRTISGYQISNKGEVRFVDVDGVSEYQRRKFNASTGRYEVQLILSRSRGLIDMDIATLVAYYFIPNPFNIKKVIFKDGDYSNLHMDNLDYEFDANGIVTPKVKTYNDFNYIRNCPISKNDIINIYKLYHIDGLEVCDIKKYYYSNISRTTISNIVNKESYRVVTIELDPIEK